jgi:hypothetical protein
VAFFGTPHDWMDIQPAGWRLLAAGLGGRCGAAVAAVERAVAARTTVDRYAAQLMSNWNLSPRRFALLPGWLLGSKYFWFVVGVVLVFCAADWIGHCSGKPHETRLTWAGWVLEVTGVFAIVVDIVKRERFFGRPSIFGDVLAWLRRFPLRKRNVVIAATGTSTSIVVGRGRLDAWHSTGPDAAVEARIASLEQNFYRLRESSQQEQDRLGKEINELQSALAHERKTREEQLATASKKLEETAVGDSYVELLSIIAVFVGLTASTVPDLVVLFFGWVYHVAALPPGLLEFVCRL